jgi:acyl-CoA thioesterase
LTAFDQDLNLNPLGNGVFSIDISPNWNVIVGPNGGYIGAMMLKALRIELDQLQTRSITFHFLSASKPGPARLDVSIEKRGRSLSTGIVKLEQNDRTIAIALGTFGALRQANEFCDVVMPRVPGPSEIPVTRRMDKKMMGHAPFRDHYDQRLAIGPTPPDTAEVAEVGGWTRFREPRLFDDEAIVAISDSWFPGIQVKPWEERVHAPTIDHTVHFLTSLPLAGGELEDFVLVDFVTDVAQQGYLVESGNIFSKDGLLIARSRQLAAILPG